MYHDRSRRAEIKGGRRRRESRPMILQYIEYKGFLEPESDGGIT
jgi:hypothetical protein